MGRPAATADDLRREVEEGKTPIVRVHRYPSFETNHALLLYGVEDTPAGLRFQGYDPNDTEMPVEFEFDRVARTFTYPRTVYFGGGPMTVYEMHRGFSCTSLRALALGALLLSSGCVTGHLLDLGRRREYLESVREAWVTQDRLVIRYDARVTDDDGRAVGRTERWAAVALADLATTTVPQVEHLRSWSGAGRRVAIRDGTGAPPDAPLLCVTRVAEENLRLAYEEPADPGVLYANAVTDVWTTPWIYPLMPLTLAFDLVTTPPLAMMAPAILVMGE
jgi:hypothetical protein